MSSKGPCRPDARKGNSFGALQVSISKVAEHGPDCKGSFRNLARMEAAEPGFRRDLMIPALLTCGEAGSHVSEPGATIPPQVARGHYEFIFEIRAPVARVGLRRAAARLARSAAARRPLGGRPAARRLVRRNPGHILLELLQVSAKIGKVWPHLADFGAS